MSKIQLVAQANLPTEYGIFKMVGFEFPDTKKEHVALVMGDISNQDEPVLARIHSECLTGDALHSLKCCHYIRYSFVLYHFLFGVLLIIGMETTN